MKRIISIMLIALLMISLIPMSAFSAFAGDETSSTGDETSSTELTEPTPETVEYNIKLTCGQFCCGQISISYPDSLSTSTSDVKLADVIVDKFGSPKINAETPSETKSGYKTVDINFSEATDVIDDQFKNGATFVTIQFTPTSDEKPVIDEFDIFDVAQVISGGSKPIALTAVASYDGEVIQTVKHDSPVDPSTETESTEPSSETTPSELEDGYYLVGTLNGDDYWTVDKITPEMKLTKEEGEKDYDEYILEWTFYAGDEIKVVKAVNGAITTWYKDGDDKYRITEDKAGEDTLYFRPEGNAEWSYFYLTVIPKTQPTTEPTTESTEPTTESTEPTTKPTEKPAYNITNESPISKKTENGGYIEVKYTAYAGDTVEVLVTPDEEHIIKSLSYTDQSGESTVINKNEDGKYIFIMPESDISIKADFISSKYMLGDGNDNKKIDISDATVVQLLLSKLLDDDGYIGQRVNIQQNEKYSITDATILQQYLAMIKTDYDNIIGTNRDYK